MVKPLNFTANASGIAPGQLLIGWVICADGTNTSIVIIRDVGQNIVIGEANLTASGAGSYQIGPYLGQDGLGIDSQGLSITINLGTPSITLFVK